MTGFGYKTGWLAICDADRAAVLSALGARPVGQAAWLEGVRASYELEDTILVTPPLLGASAASWILVAGQYVGHNCESLDVAGLSAMLGCEVQLFVSHRVVNLHRWERAIDGVRIRAFEYLGEAGEVRLWFGEPDPIEMEVGLPRTFDMDRMSDDWVSIREDDVMRVAGSW